MSRLRLVYLFCLFVFPLSAACNQQSETRSDIYELQRLHMVRWDLKPNGIKSARVLSAMMTVPRHLFLPDRYKEKAYEDVDLPISQFQSTPRPSVVAKTIELLKLNGSDRVLEVGTGRGYQTALLAELAGDVYTIEIVPKIAQEAKRILKRLKYHNIELKIGDGYQGWAEHQPFDAILVMAAAQKVPQPLLNQLKQGGRLVMPVGTGNDQKLVLYLKGKNGLREKTIMPVNLKPMEGRAAGQYW